MGSINGPVLCITSFDLFALSKNTGRMLNVRLLRFADGGFWKKFWLGTVMSLHFRRSTTITIGCRQCSREKAIAAFSSRSRWHQAWSLIPGYRMAAQCSTEPGRGARKIAMLSPTKLAQHSRYWTPILSLLLFHMIVPARYPELRMNLMARPMVQLFTIRWQWWLFFRSRLAMLKARQQQIAIHSGSRW